VKLAIILFFIGGSGGGGSNFTSNPSSGNFGDFGDSHSDAELDAFVNGAVSGVSAFVDHHTSQM